MIVARKIITAIFAISDGWNWIGPILNHRDCPFALVPTKITAVHNVKATKYASVETCIQNLYGIFEINNIAAIPSALAYICLFT